ncbi:DUF6489 family protein [Beijerinckia sp. L45]|uniref:DUF6489 family protein n=1 Tax=Beijerinckia sp. L45 TaxID=1641855 RepID=UPI00131EA72E|nr:DUF6489 family protein [Beijerinckia sp. L45]
MKVTVEVDCTPIEARQFFGLPDVQPMQAAIMAEMEKNIMKEAQRFSPDALMQTWFANVPQSADWFRDLFSKMIVTSGTGLKKSSDPKP